jgi:hypothetical protein
MLAMMLSFFTIPALLIAGFYLFQGYKKKEDLSVIIGSSILGITWFVMVVISNTRAFLD